MDRLIEKRKKLIDRIEKNFANYKAAVMKLDKKSIFDKAAEIAAVKRVAYYMINIHRYYEKDIDCLLKFRNPMKLVADRYQVNLRAYLNDVVARICDPQDITGDYPFIPVAKTNDSVQ